MRYITGHLSRPVLVDQGKVVEWVDVEVTVAPVHARGVGRWPLAVLTLFPTPPGWRRRMLTAESRDRPEYRHDKVVSSDDVVESRWLGHR